MSDCPKLTPSSQSKRFPKHKKGICNWGGRPLWKVCPPLVCIFYCRLFRVFKPEPRLNNAGRCFVGGAVNLAWRIKPLPQHCSGWPLSGSCWVGCWVGVLVGWILSFYLQFCLHKSVDVALFCTLHVKAGFYFISVFNVFQMWNVVLLQVGRFLCSVYWNNFVLSL